MNQNPIPAKPAKIETKTTPFSLPQTATENLNKKQIRKFRYMPRPQNDSFGITTVILLIILVIGVGYLGYTFARLQSTPDTSNTGNVIDITIPVSDTDVVESTDSPENWSRREFKINNNVVWSLEMPNSFSQTSTEIVEGVVSFFGDIEGTSYKLELAFPLFDNYPGGLPQSLADWVAKEKAFLPSVSVSNMQSSTFALEGNLEAALIAGLNEVIRDNGSSREFNQNKTVVLYIWKSKIRNPSRITLIPQGIYNEDDTKAVMEKIAASLIF